MPAADNLALKRALSAYDRGHAQEAEAVLRDLARRYPADFAALETLGLIYAEWGRLGSAIPLLERAATVRPSSGLALANLGAAYLKDGRDQDALRVLQRAVSLDPANPRTQSNFGQALVHASRFAQAADAFKRAAQFEPNNPDLLYNWSLALFGEGRFAEAAVVLRRVPEKQASPQVQSLLGDVEERLGHFEAAVEHFKRAAALDPSEQNIFALGLEFAIHWTFNAAIEIFSYGVSKYPDSARLQSGLGAARYGSGDYAGASEIFSQLLARDPDNAHYADLLGRSCGLTVEERTPACDILVDFSERHPRDAVVASFAAASILHRPAVEQDLELARRLVDRAIAADPQLATAHFELGALEQQGMHWQESVTPLERAVSLDPQFAEAHYRLARAYSHVGRREQAQREIAIQQEFSQQKKQADDARMKEVTTFLVTLQR